MTSLLHKNGTHYIFLFHVTLLHTYYVKHIYLCISCTHICCTHCVHLSREFINKHFQSKTKNKKNNPQSWSRNRLQITDSHYNCTSHMATAIKLGHFLPFLCPLHKTATRISLNAPIFFIQVPDSRKCCGQCL